MAKLDHLISDIENVFINGKQPSEADLQIFAKDAVDVIRKQFTKRTPAAVRNVMRFSALGKPNRQLWYLHNKAEEKQEEQSVSQHMKFLYGDLIEHLLFLLIKTAGYKVTDQQAEIKFDDNIKGHIDGRVNNVVVDIKSASDGSFHKFRTRKLFEDDPFGYITQISGYAGEDDEAAFIVMNKSSGDLHVMTVDSLDMIDFPKRVREVQAFIDLPTMPERCYAPKIDKTTGNSKLAIGCVYCDFKHDCWKDANNGKGLRRYDYSYGSVYFTDIKREPNLEEVPYVPTIKKSKKV